MCQTVSGLAYRSYLPEWVMMVVARNELTKVANSGDVLLLCSLIAYLHGPGSDKSNRSARQMKD